MTDGPSTLTDKSLKPFRKIYSFTYRRQDESSAAKAADPQIIIIQLQNWQSSESLCQQIDLGATTEVTVSLFRQVRPLCTD
jgi:hypothetical protein